MAFGTRKVFGTFEERVPVLSVRQKMRAKFYKMAYLAENFRQMISVLGVNWVFDSNTQGASFVSFVWLQSRRCAVDHKW